MESEIQKVRLLNYYRAAELHSAELLQHLLQKTDDPELQITLTRQLADETRHIQLWTDLICELGGTPTVIRKGDRPYVQWQAGKTASVLELLALTHVVEERLQHCYREHAARGGEDPRIVAVLQAIATDEDWHLAGVRSCLAKQEKKEGRTRVQAALDHYWTLKAKVAVKSAPEEEKALRRRTRTEHATFRDLETLS